jgi:hypothetical protein
MVRRALRLDVEIVFGLKAPEESFDVNCPRC